MNYKFEMISESKNSFQFKITSNNTFLSFKDVFDLWISSSDFIQFYIDGINKFTE